MLLSDRVTLAIAHAKREGGKFAVMFFDLDGFKQVNDNHGHRSGDLLLQVVAARLQPCLREGDTLARIGGDEFVFLLPNIHNTKEVKKIAIKLLREINKDFEVDGTKLSLTASIGIALYPDNGKTLDELINGADKAMYFIKNGNKNGSAFLSELHDVNMPSNFL